MQDRHRFDTQEQEEQLIPVISQKHFNDSNNLVSTKFRCTLRGDEEPKEEKKDQQEVVLEEKEQENKGRWSVTVKDETQAHDLRDNTVNRSGVSSRLWCTGSHSSEEEDMSDKKEENCIQNDGNDEQSIDLMSTKNDQIQHENKDLIKCSNSSSNTTNISKTESSNDGDRSWFRKCFDFINRLRNQCGIFVNNKYVQFLIIVMISINAIMMGLATYDFIKNDPYLKNAFEIIDFVFLIIFTIELGLQFIYHGWRLLLDGWLIFDLVVIVTSWSFSSVQIVRAFRIVRALRLVTRVKILKHLIVALFDVTPRMAAIGLMLCVVFYIFGVMMTQLFKDLYDEGYTDYNYFGGLDWTFFTLFQIMTLDDWASVSRQVAEVYKWAWTPFVAFVIISGFIIVNLIIAVICDAIGALHADGKSKLHGDFDDCNSDAGSDISRTMDIREQLDTFEDQMEDLTRIQARTFHMLQYLTQQVQMHNIRKEIQSKSMDFALKSKKSKNSSPKDEYNTLRR